MTPRWSYANGSSENTAVYTELVPVMEPTHANSTKVALQTMPVTIATSQPVKSLPEGRPVHKLSLLPTRPNPNAFCFLQSTKLIRFSTASFKAPVWQITPCQLQEKFYIRFTVPNNAHHIKALDSHTQLVCSDCQLPSSTR